MSVDATNEKDINDSQKKQENRFILDPEKKLSGALYSILPFPLQANFPALSIIYG